MDGNMIYMPIALSIGAICSWILAAVLHRRRMAERIARDAAVLEHTQDQIAEIMMRLPIGIVVVNAGNGEVVFSNPAGVDLLMGRAPASLPLMDEHGQPLDQASHPFGNGEEGRRAKVFSMEDVGRRRRYYEIRSMVLKGGASGAVEIVYIVQDDTARFELARAERVATA